MASLLPVLPYLRSLGLSIMSKMISRHQDDYTLGQSFPDQVALLISSIVPLILSSPFVYPLM